MPVSLEQWRASVGANNSARSHMLKKYCGSKKAPRNLLDLLLAMFAFVLTLGRWPNVEVTPTGHVKKRSTGHTHKGGGCGWMYVVLPIVLVTLLLVCSGDIETNPGPLSGPFGLTSSNLAKVRDLTRGARLQWLDLGLELGLDETTLKAIEVTYHGDVEVCFREMLSKWLKTDPPPTWEALIAALEKDSIGCTEVTKKVKRACDLDLECSETSPVPTTDGAPSIATTPHAVMSTMSPTTPSNTQSPTTPAVMPTGGLQADKIVRMEQEFEHLVDATEESFKENQVPLIKLQRAIKHIPVSLKRDLGEHFQYEVSKILKTESIMDFFILLSFYWDYLNPGLLEFLVARFGIDADVELLHKYLEKLEQFKADTKLIEYLQYRGIEISASRYQRITAIMGPGWQQNSLQDAVRYKAQLARELEIQPFMAQLATHTKQVSSPSIALKTEGNEEEYIQQIEDAILKNMTIMRSLAHGMFVGPTGAGKTSLMDRLLGRPRKKFSPSTGVAEQVVVVNVDMDNPSTFHSVTATKDNIWKEKKYDESLNIQIKESVASTQTVPKASPHLRQEKDGQSTTKLADKVELASVPTQNSKTRAKHAPTQKLTHHVIKTIKKYGGYTNFKKFIEKTFSLYLRDTGGQVEFQEMLPLLISGPSIFFFVFRLDLDFKSKFEVKYRKSAGESLNCYTSSITTEEAFLQCLASVYAMDTSGEVSVKTHKPLVFVVGTHRDKLGPSADEKIAKLNQYLISLIGEKGFSDLIVSADRGKGEVMFTVENTSDSDEDFKAIRSQVNNIVSSRPEFSIEYPIRYLLFSLELDTNEHHVLSFDECKVMADKYGIEGDQLVHLLQFLHLRIGVIRYFNKDGVKHIVIKEPQVLFNAATSIIIKTFSSKALTDKEVADFEKGILTACVLETVVKDFAIDFKVFLKLLTHLRITAPFPSPGDKDDNNKKYFFPSVLNHYQECTKENTLSEVSPLCVKFKCEHVPKGLFGVLVTHLMNPDLEEGATSHNTTFTLMQDKIFKDQVSFEVLSPGVHDEMALKLHLSHLEIKFFPEHSDDRDTSITEVCSNVRQILETSIQKSLQDLHYSMDKTAPEMCLRCDTCSELHPVTKGKKSFKMFCKKIRATKKIPPQGKWWYNEEPPVQPPSSRRLQNSDLVWLCKKLGPYAYKWKGIALGLCFTDAELCTIEATPLLLPGAPLSYLRAVLSHWLQWAPGDVRGSTDYATRDTLRRAVDRAGLGLTAQEL